MFLINSPLSLILFLKKVRFKNLNPLTASKILRFIDYGLFFYIICISIMDLVGLCSSLVNCLSVYPSGIEDCVMQMNNRGTPDNYGFLPSGGPNSPNGPPGGGFPPGVPGPHHTTVQIIHDDGSWSNGIRNLFIYGSGGARLIMNVRRGGSPAQQFFIISSTFIAEGASRILINSLNDPTYIRAHMYNLQAI
jgi:hypothetical protein